MCHFGNTHPSYAKAARQFDWQFISSLPLRLLHLDFDERMNLPSLFLRHQMQSRLFLLILRKLQTNHLIKEICNFLMGSYRIEHMQVIILVFFIPIAKLNILLVDALTEAVAEFHIEDVLVLAAAIPSAVFLQALDSYKIIATALYVQGYYIART